MGKRKLYQVGWSMMFKVDADRRNHSDYVWSVLRKWDKVKPEAFCEHAYSEDTELGEETGDSWYDWHGFKSMKSLREAVPLVFEAFPEVQEIDLYKYKESGSFADCEHRGKVTR